jgi:hypothetical protein
MLAFLLALLVAIPVRAEGLEIKSAELEPTEESYLLKADLDITLTPPVEDALNKGVPLNFVADFELKRPRWYWFDEVVASAQQTIRLSYHALTRQYELKVNSQHKTFSSFAEAKDELVRLRDWKVADRSLLKKRQTYVAALRMRLDTSQLPKPLQVNALASKDWTLDSDWHSWTVTP